MARNLGFSFGRTPEGRDRELAELEQRLARQSSISQTPKTQTETFSGEITSFKDHWLIPNVTYRDIICSVRLAKSLLNKGQQHTQREWINYRNIAEPRREFYTGSLPLHHSVFKALYDQRNDPTSKDIVQFIQENLENNWIATLTQITYQIEDIMASKKEYNDGITHNVGTINQYTLINQKLSDKRLIISTDTNIAKPFDDSLRDLTGASWFWDIPVVYSQFDTPKLEIRCLGRDFNQVIAPARLTITKAGTTCFDFLGTRKTSGPSFGMCLLEEESEPIPEIW